MEQQRAKATSGEYVAQGNIYNLGVPSQQIEKNPLYSSEGDDFISPALYE